MKIIVFIKSVPDAKIPLELDESVHRLREAWNIPVLNPDDAAGLEAALALRDRIPGAGVTAVHLGPPSGERWLREAVAIGCDEGLRLWDEDLEDIRTAGKALVFSRIAAISGFDLIFTGTRSLDTGTGQLAVMLASSLNVPCIRRAVSVDPVREDVFRVTRNLDRGYRERIEISGPAVVAMESDGECGRYASLPAALESLGKEIPCLDLPAIGIPAAALRRADSLQAFGPLRFPEPKLQYVEPPDSSLPAFERRRQIGRAPSAGREGKVVKGAEDAVAGEIFQALLRGGWLDHLQKRRAKV